MSAQSLYGVLLYIVTLFVVSAFFVKKALNSFEEYSLCGRSLSALFIVFTYLGTWIGGGTIIGLSSSTYLSGVSQYWILGIPYITGFLFAFLFIIRIRQIRLHSIGDMMSLRYPEYNEVIRIPVTLGIIIRNVTMIGMQFSALSFLITYAFPIDRNLAVLLTFLLITSYTVLSGLWGVVVTDVLQGALQTTGLILLLILTVRFSGGLPEIYNFYHSIGKDNFLDLFGQDNTWQLLIFYFLAFGTFFLMGDQSDWERIYSAKTDKIALWGYLIPLTITLILLLIPAYLGVFQRVLLTGEINSAYAIYAFVIERLSPHLATFILITIFAAIMSSADSFMLATGTVFANDIVKRFINKKANDRELIFWTKLFVIISGAIGFAFAINIEDIIFLWITGIAISTTITLPAYLCAWFTRRVNTVGALAGIIAGTIYCCGWLLGLFPFSIAHICYGTVCNLAITLAVALTTRPPDPLAVQRTYFWHRS
jgi:SSS family solute:Na+ symporter